MSPKLIHLLLLAVALVGGWLAGRALRRVTGGRQRIGAVIGLLGALAFITAAILAQHDRRFMYVAEAALFIQLAGAVSAAGTPKAKSAVSQTPSK